jgi:acyl carrier protein
MPSEALLNRVREIVANIFNLPVEQITPASSPATIEAWDSMAALSLTLELEQEFDVSILPEQAEQMKDVGAIAKGLEEMGVQA